MNADELADLPYEEVKGRAIELAEQHRDVGFFYDLFRHTPALHAASTEGGSIGDLSGSLVDLVEAAREVFGSGNVGEMEPLFRARFEQYILERNRD